MPKSVEFCQLVSRAIDHTTWNIPKIRDRDRCRWRNIDNAHLVENPACLCGHDHFEDAIFRTKKIMEARGWNTEITDTKEQCHEYLYYQHCRLKCHNRINLNQAERAVAGFTRQPLPSLLLKGGPLLKTITIKPHVQRNLFPASSDPPAKRYISVYRVSLVKDESVSFGNVRLANSQEAQALIQNLILTKGHRWRCGRYYFCRIGAICGH